MTEVLRVKVDGEVRKTWIVVLAGRIFYDIRANSPQIKKSKQNLLLPCESYKNESVSIEI